MIYCVGLKFDCGLVFVVDMCINVGVDNIVIFKKLYIWEKLGECVIVLMFVGNLVVIQVVVFLLSEYINFVEDDWVIVMMVKIMFQVVWLVGSVVCEVKNFDGEVLVVNVENFFVIFILGG